MESRNSLASAGSLLRFSLGPCDGSTASLLVTGQDCSAALLDTKNGRSVALCYGSVACVPAEDLSTYSCDMTRMIASVPLVALDQPMADYGLMPSVQHLSSMDAIAVVSLQLRNVPVVQDLVAVVATKNSSTRGHVALAAH
ncbi:hypothetical protein AAVH_11977 [Aphelenchoides avenae]|nr:hypothetical protein AAVH_11976 [Aphelenchus avenae]KAH7720550.1 hypothetical protein AAVH_11977 [Aphelenchus avenae]